MQAGGGSESVLKLAIEQYEQIIRLQPDSMDDHLLLGQLSLEQQSAKSGERI